MCKTGWKFGRASRAIKMPPHFLGAGVLGGFKFPLGPKVARRHKQKDPHMFYPARYRV